MINYYLLTKPGIVLGNLITVAAGFLLASKGHIDVGLFFVTLLGLSLIMASACVFNNYIDQPIDKKMERTKNRPLVAGLILGSQAIFFAIGLGILGFLVLFISTNLLTVAVAGFGFFVYVVLYSFWKCHTIYSTAIGSLAGAVPPVVGYCAVTNHLDAGAVILFAMMVLWQMPHFFAIAIYHFDDYTRAKIQVLPIIKGIFRTKIHMVLYILGFTFTAMMLTFLNYTGYVYLVVAISLGLVWLGLCFKGFNSSNEQIWGRQMFYLSLVVITTLSFVIPFNIRLD